MSQQFINSEASLRKHQRLDQNAISHAWYNDIATQTADTPENVKCECKLRFGVPILRAEDPDFREMYDASILRSLSYEQKLRAMRYIPITSNMTKPQLSRYLEHIQMSYAQQGVVVTFEKEERAA